MTKTRETDLVGTILVTTGICSFTKELTLDHQEDRKSDYQMVGSIELSFEELKDLLSNDDILYIKAIVLTENEPYIQFKTTGAIEYIKDEKRKLNRYKKALEYAYDKYVANIRQPAVSPPETLQTARERRNSLLKRTDWTLLPDSPLSEKEKSEYIKYRRGLRDMFKNVSTVDDIVWPKNPSS
jgi:hypothetical protein